jgi:hypothetical protein
MKHHVSTWSLDCMIVIVRCCGGKNFPPKILILKVDESDKFCVDMVDTFIMIIFLFQVHP